MGTKQRNSIVAKDTCGDTSQLPIDFTDCEYTTPDSISVQVGGIKSIFIQAPPPDVVEAARRCMDDPMPLTADIETVCKWVLVEKN